jgi:hypothetical protein
LSTGRVATNSPNAIEGLTTAVATALALFGDAASASYGDRLTKIVLFGSRAPAPAVLTWPVLAEIGHSPF